MPRCVSNADEVMDRPLCVKREGGDFPYPQKGKRACPNPRSRRFPPFLGRNRHDPSARRSDHYPQCRRKGETSHTPRRGNGHVPIPDHAGSAHFWEKTGMTPPHSGCTFPLYRRKGETSHPPKGGTGMSQSPIMPAPPISGRKPA